MEYRVDFSHKETKLVKYPDGMCARRNCWPCASRRLDRENEQTYEGLARMAAARRAAVGRVGRSADDDTSWAMAEKMNESLLPDRLDELALSRAPYPTVLSGEHGDYREPGEPWRQSV